AALYAAKHRGRNAVVEHGFVRLVDEAGMVLAGEARPPPRLIHQSNPMQSSWRLPALSAGATPYPAACAGSGSSSCSVTTRLRPPRLAWYIARSQRSIRSSIDSPNWNWPTPIDTVMPGS